MQFKKLLKKTLKWKCEIVLLLLLVGVLVFKLYKHKEEFQERPRQSHTTKTPAYLSYNPVVID